MGRTARQVLLGPRWRTADRRAGARLADDLRPARAVRAADRDRDRGQPGVAVDEPSTAQLRRVRSRPYQAGEPDRVLPRRRRRLGESRPAADRLPGLPGEDPARRHPPRRSITRSRWTHRRRQRSLPMDATDLRQRAASTLNHPRSQGAPRMTARPAAAQTAFGPMVIAACEQILPADQRLFDDPDAIRLLPPSQRLIVGACRWKPVYQLLVRATDSKAQGLWASMLCRKRYADDKVRDALDDGIKQFVFLGAGLDTRPYRLVAPTGARSFETDLQANIAYKRRRLTETYGRLPANATLTPVDLETDDLTAALNATGFDWTEPAMFIWEAVTQYLAEDAVRRTLSCLTSAVPGSRLIFTYLRRDFL